MPPLAALLRRRPPTQGCDPRRMTKPAGGAVDGSGGLTAFALGEVWWRAVTKAVTAPVGVVLLLTSCASVQIDPQQPIATTLAPFNAQLGLNRVSVPEGSRLAGALIDGKAAYCTVDPAWFAIGEARSVCFTDEARSGYLDKYYVLGTLKTLTYEAHIPYTINPTSGWAPTLGARPPSSSLTPIERPEEAILRPATISGADAQLAIAKKFRDPSSVQFGELRLLERADGRVVVCGNVNAKNGYGGYVGFHPFMAVVGPGNYVDGPLVANFSNSIVNDQALGEISRRCQ